MNHAGPLFDTATNPLLDLAVSPCGETAGVCLIGTRNGLFRSDDGGNTWHQQESVTVPVTAIGFRPQVPGTPVIVAGTVGGVLRSVDGGESWTPADFAVPLLVVSCLAWLDDSTVLAGTVEDGIFRSGDGGISWKPVNTGVLDYRILILAAGRDNPEPAPVFAVTATSLMTSRSHGRSWLELPLPAGEAGIELLASRQQADGTMLLMAGTETTGICLSADGGQHWHRLKVPGDSSGSVVGVDITDGGRLVVIRESDLLVSDDLGVTWQTVLQGVPPMLAASLIDRRDARAGILAAFQDGQVRRIGN